MKLLYLADAPYVHTRRWVEHFTGLGQACEVISFRPAQIPGARVTHVDGFERLGKLRYLVQARRVAGLIRDRGPDLVHALHLTSYGFLAAIAGFHPLIVSAWGTDILEAPGLTPFHAWLTRWTLRRADLITATGPHLATATASYAPPGTQVRVVPYGVDLDRFRPAARNQDGKKIVIGSVARFSSEKGLRYLIEAIARLPELAGGFRLMLAGDGPERPRLEALVRERGLAGRVEFRGWIEPEDLPAFLQSLDIFALPSIYEGFGVAAAEASAMSLPVVGSRVHGIPDVVVDGETGLLVPAADPEALAGALETLARDQALRLRMGEAGRAYIAAHYDWRDNAALMARVYEDVLRAGASAGAR